MDISTERVGEVTFARVDVDELDASNADEFKREIGPVLNATSRLVVDLSRVRFIDSSGLGVFLSMVRQLNARQGTLKLCHMSRQVRAVFELVRMHRIIDICDSRQDAVRAFTGQP